MSRGWANYSIGNFSLVVQWDILPGQVTALFGPSGAGKSTTLKIIAGLVRPDNGHIEIGSKVVFDAADKTMVPAHGRRTGYLTQRFDLFPHLSVCANIAYGLTGLLSEERKERVRRLIRALDLEEVENRYPWELSGGQQQRAALGRAMAPEPDILLLDEPFNSLDAELRQMLMGELRSTVARSRIPAMLVTHDREVALAMADWVQVMDQGKIIAEGIPLDVLGQPGRGRVARLVGVENLLDLTVEHRNYRDGTMTCEGEGISLEVPLDRESVKYGNGPCHDARSGNIRQSVTVGIRASDIILSNNELQGLSARNRLRGVVAGVEVHPPGYTVTLECGQPLKCHITGAAMTEMDIRPGQELWAVFKASSCFLVQP